MTEAYEGEFTNSVEAVASEFLTYGSRQDRPVPWPTYRFEGDSMTFAIVNSDNKDARDALDVVLREDLKDCPTTQRMERALSSDRLTFAQVLLLTADSQFKDSDIPSDVVRWELVKRAERASSQLQTIMDGKRLGRKIDETPEMQIPELPFVRSVDPVFLIIGMQSLARFKSELIGRKSPQRPVRG